MLNYGIGICALACHYYFDYYAPVLAEFPHLIPILFKLDKYLLSFPKIYRL
ncbi:MAG: hypothetical protein G5Z42_01150 [Caldisphaeraceae archaeon]|nr:hypothetical protein [Caldisphaeraceae archaeon]